MQNELYKEERNLIDSKNPPKSLFTIEYTHATYTHDDTYPFHYHDWYELYFMQEGSCTYRIGKKKYRVNKGDWIFVPPNVLHKVFYNTSPHGRILIYFSRDYLSTQILTRINDFKSNPVYKPKPEDSEFMHSIVSKLLREFSNPDEFSAEMYKNFLFELFVLFISKPSFAPSENEKDLVIAHVMDYINCNYAESLSLELLADMNGISTGYLSRRFKAVTGLSVSEYVRMIRIRQAKLLLIKTNDSISEISDKCGFNDSNYFSYVFKEEEKVSPLKYRKAHS